jgi:hypothetical protein
MDGLVFSVCKQMMKDMEESGFDLYDCMYYTILNRASVASVSCILLA